jgi:uncharacterized repeat protein (TIGR03803 family)
MKRWSLVLAAAVALAPLAANAAVEKVIYSFGDQPDGEHVYAGLTSVNGTLYGTAFYGGQYAGRSGNEYPGGGGVFSLDPKSGADKMLWSFGNGADGVYPYAGLTPLKGMLYGTTWQGGDWGDHGTVYSLDPRTGQEKVLYAFYGQPDGEFPQGGLIAYKGLLYGTTMYGGLSGQFGDGTIFSVDPATGAYKQLYSFRGGQTDGQWCQSGLVEAGGKLYGATVIGGYGEGTVFSYDPKTGVEKLVWEFGGANDGQSPWSAPVSLNGVLYGATYFGGKYGLEDGGYGVVYALDPGTRKEKVLWSFGKTADDGEFPLDNLVAFNGLLYGTNYAGGKYGAGTVFSVDPKTGHEKVLWSFGAGADGAQPYGNLIPVGDALYGTTWLGGQGDYGVVFSLKP